MQKNGILYLAGPHSKDSIECIISGFEKLISSPINFEIKEDNKLIGGFRAIIDGRLYDASYETKTQNLLKHLKTQTLQ